MTAKKKVSKKKVAKKKTVVKKVGVKLGNMATDFLKLQAKITKANKVVKALEEERSELKKMLIPAIEATKQTGVTVKMGSVNIKKEDVFAAKDWSKIYKHILKTKNFGLLNKALGQGLLREYYEDGIQIEGIEHMTKKKITYGFKKS